MKAINQKHDRYGAFRIHTKTTKPEPKPRKRPAKKVPAIKPLRSVQRANEAIATRLETQLRCSAERTMMENLIAISSYAHQMAPRGGHLRAHINDVTKQAKDWLST